MTLTVDTNSEAIEAAEALLDMEVSMKELEDDGVSPVCTTELTRQVLDEVNGTVLSAERFVPVEDYDNDGDEIRDQPI